MGPVWRGGRGRRCEGGSYQGCHWRGGVVVVEVEPVEVVEVVEQVEVEREVIIEELEVLQGYGGLGGKRKKNRGKDLEKNQKGKKE